MKVGVPKEIKNHEYRVGLVPATVRELTDRGHDVFVETAAGSGIGLEDANYENVGAKILPTHEDVFTEAEMIVKVKEPLEPERALLQEGQIVFTFLHLAANEALSKTLLEKNITGISYDTVQDGGRLPLLAPMSVIAGRMAPVMGGYFLSRHNGGKGALIGGAFGIPHGHVVIVGGGVSGLAAAKVAAGMGATVTVLEVNGSRISYLEDILPRNVAILKSNSYNIRTIVPEADILIGAVLIPGARAPKLITERMLESMEKGSVFVDIAIDQGGCAVTSRATTHADPVFEAHGVIHYCVANMPGAYPRTSTMALTNATLPFVLAIANGSGDWKAVVEALPPLATGFNTFRGKLVCPAVAEALGVTGEDMMSLI